MGSSNSVSSASADVAVLRSGGGLVLLASCAAAAARAALRRRRPEPCKPWVPVFDDALGVDSLPVRPPGNDPSMLRCLMVWCASEHMGVRGTMPA